MRRSPHDVVYTPIAVTSPLLSSPLLSSPLLSSPLLSSPRNSGTAVTPIRTGHESLDEVLGGGIPLGSLTLIEVDSSTGESVLCQRLAYEATEDGHQVAYLTSEPDVTGLVSQMDSLGVDLSCHVKGGYLRIDPMELSSTGDDTDLLAGLLENIRALPRRYKVIFVDAISTLVADGDAKSTTDFFSSCKRVCTNGRTIVLLAHSHILTKQMLTHIVSLCDLHLSLRVEKRGSKLVETLEIAESAKG